MDEQLRELERKMHDDPQAAMRFVQTLARAEGSPEPYLTRKINELECLVKTILIAEAQLTGFPICIFERFGTQTSRSAFYVGTIEEPEDLDENYLFFTPDGLFKHTIDHSITNPQRLPSNDPDREVPCHMHYERIRETIQKKEGMDGFAQDKSFYEQSD